MGLSNFSGKFFKTMKGRDSFEIYAADATLVFPLASMLQKEFSLEAVSLPLFGLDGIYLDLSKESVLITIGWDNWSGLFIMANEEDGDALIQEIGKFLENKMDELEVLNSECIENNKENA